MSCPMDRRQFLGCSMAGGALLAANLDARGALAVVEAGWPQPAPAKIHAVYVGRTGGIYLSRPTEEVGRLKEYVNDLAQRLGDVEFVGGEFVPETAAAEVVKKIADADAVLMIHLSGHGGAAPGDDMDQIIEANKPTAVFSQPFSGHGWMYFPQWQKKRKKVVLLPTSDWSELDRVVGLMRVAPRLRQTKILVVRGPMG
ncbi:MAG: hypothetical protein HYV26_19840, partial [Candidatus Hydrogenedentes bacterium]|nr:hypothetical protein [Candidatus Hydrogenedentota bacterium]